MSKIKATAEWDGHNWVAVLEGGGVTQAKRIEGLRQRLVEVAKLMHDLDLGPGDIELSAKTPVPGVALDFTERRAELAAFEAALNRDTFEAVRRFKDAGLPLRDIGSLVGLSHQRVGQLLGETVAKKRPAPKRKARTSA